MTPLQMYADARRRGWDLAQMRRNLSTHYLPGGTTELLDKLEEVGRWLEVADQLQLDAQVLSWKWAPWPRGRHQASLVTLNGETVAIVAAGIVARNFGWTLWKRPYWVIVDDPDALAPRQEAGQAGVHDYGTGFSTRTAAAKNLVRIVQAQSIALAGVDHFDIPEFKIPERN